MVPKTLPCPRFLMTFGHTVPPFARTRLYILFSVVCLGRDIGQNNLETIYCWFDVVLNTETVLLTNVAERMRLRAVLFALYVKLVVFQVHPLLLIYFPPSWLIPCSFIFDISLCSFLGSVRRLHAYSWVAHNPILASANSIVLHTVHWLEP